MVIIIPATAGLKLTLLALGSFMMVVHLVGLRVPSVAIVKSVVGAMGLSTFNLVGTVDTRRNRVCAERVVFRAHSCGESRTRCAEDRCIGFTNAQITETGPK